jgi:adenosylhomocysteine nucleosidase
MQSELRPLKRRLGLRRRVDGESEWHVGATGEVELVASIAQIGTKAAAAATEHLLDTFDVHHVVVAGIAGGVDPALDIGELVVPEVVIDWSTGREYRHRPLGGVPVKGGLLTSDELLYQDDVLRDLIERDIVAVDMETSAVAGVCERRGVPWSVFRAISDRASDASVLAEGIMGMIHADGSPNVPVVARYLATRPHRIPHLVRLGRGSQAAARNAADAVARAVG